MRRIILVTDLDGTFLEGSGDFPANGGEFIDFLLTRGVEFVVATSRSAHNVAELFHKTAEPFYAICSDGGLTAYLSGGQWSVVSEILLPPFVASDFAAHMIKMPPYEVLVFLGSKNNFEILFLRGRNCISSSLSIMRDDLRDRRPLREVPIDIADLASGSQQFMEVRAVSLFHEEAQVKAASNLLAITPSQVKLLLYPEIRCPGYWWLDAVSPNLGKGSALQTLVKSEPEPTIIALGDGLNDVSLFDLASTSFCPRDAVPEILSRSHHRLSAPCGAAFLQEVMQHLHP